MSCRARNKSGPTRSSAIRSCTWREKRTIKENVPLSVTFRVNRKEVRGDFHKQPADVDVLESFLKPDKKVPVGGKSLELIRDKELPKDDAEAARVLYDVVNAHMR